MPTGPDSSAGLVRLPPFITCYPFGDIGLGLDVTSGIGYPFRMIVLVFHQQNKKKIPTNSQINIRYEKCHNRYKTGTQTIAIAHTASIRLVSTKFRRMDVLNIRVQACLCKDRPWEIR